MNGLSQNVSGYLPKNECYSKSISLYDIEQTMLREERIVYSHTAWLKECNYEDSKGIFINIKVKNEKHSLLDLLNELANRLNLQCYSMQIYVEGLGDEGTEIRGRVLKHMPEKPFKDIPEVVDISFEKEFKLEKNEKMYGMGTKYERYEPEWTEFTNGGKYERRGHIHATIIENKNSINKKHRTFHLRDVTITKESKVQVVFNPINTIYRIYPIHKDKNVYICDASLKKIDDVIENIRLIDEKI